MSENTEKKTLPKTGLNMDAAKEALAKVKEKKKVGKSDKADESERAAARAKEKAESKAEKQQSKKEKAQEKADALAKEAQDNIEAYVPDVILGVKEVVQDKVLNKVLAENGWDEVNPGDLLMETLRCLSKEEPKAAVAAITALLLNKDLAEYLVTQKAKFVGVVEETDGKMKASVEVQLSK